MAAISNCNACDMKIIKALLDYGADVNIPTYHGTAFFAIEWMGGIDESRHVFWEMFKRDPDVNARSEATGKTLLMEALTGMYWPEVDIIKALIDGGANVNVRDDRGCTPLMHGGGPSSEKDQTEFLRLLLDAGADVNAKNEDGQTPLMMKARSYSPELTDLMLSNGADINAKDKEGQTALIYAAKGGHIDNVKLLLDRGADVNVKGNDGCSPLIWAAKYNDADKMRLFLESGADANAQDNEEGTALIYVAKKGNAEAVKAVLARNPEKNARDNLGMTALSHAIFFGHSEVVELLEKAGAQPVEDETREQMRDKILSQVTEAHIWWDTESEYEGIELHVSLCNDRQENITFEGLELQAEIRAYKAKRDDEDQDILDRLLYSKKIIWNGVIQVPNGYLGLDFSDPNIGHFGAVQVSIKLPDGREVEDQEFGYFTSPRSQ